MIRYSKGWFLILSSFILKVFCFEEIYPQDFTFWDEDSKTIYLKPLKTQKNKQCADTDTCHVSEQRIPLVNWGITIENGLKWNHCKGEEKCLEFYVAKVESRLENNCEKIHWTSSKLSELKDCINLIGHWYGGGQQYSQPWPLESNPRKEVPFVISDMINNPDIYGSVSERFWLSSAGIFIKVEEAIPLFFSMPDNDGDGTADQMCFSSRYGSPFAAESTNGSLNLTYYLCFGDDIRQVYEMTYPKFFSYPDQMPDERMLTYPVWSTWAEYHTDINQAKVLHLARNIKENSFPNSQIQIDDDWEVCYGDAIFNKKKFPNPRNMVEELQNMGFRVTLWVHPFINNICESFEYADLHKYFVKDINNNTLLTSWWQGENIAGLIDFTNEEAKNWWTGRLIRLLNDTGLDGFKFDAGEASWLPKSYTLQSDKKLWPNAYTTSYIDTVSKFGNICEVRVGFGSQKNSLFVRMLDKSSLWSNKNGLKTLIPSLLHSGLLGYPFVLPDMVGGNAYEGRPTPELFVRWAQANTFMPAIQFSLLPWHFDNEFINATKISLEVSSLHSRFSPLLIDLANKSRLGNGPIVKPTWWLCPEEEECLLADQQFLLGENVLVTPIIHPAASSLEVTFPPGRWRRYDNGRVYTGISKQILTDISIESIVFFERI